MFQSVETDINTLSYLGHGKKEKISNLTSVEMWEEFSNKVVAQHWNLDNCISMYSILFINFRNLQYLTLNSA